VTSEHGLSYVFKRDGSRIVRQQIEVGVMNDNEIVVRKGLEKGDKVYLVPPADKTQIETVSLPGVKPVPPSSGAADTPRSVSLPAKPAAKKP
jgi:hypothetical protein